MKKKRHSNMEDLSPEERLAREKKRLNLVFYNVKESCADEETSRLRKDEESVKAILKKILPVNNIRYTGVKRVGEINVNSPYPRLLKITVFSDKEKSLVLNHAKKVNRGVKDKSKRIFINEDFTVMQESFNKKLREEFKIRTANGEKNLTIKKGKIVCKKMENKITRKFYESNSSASESDFDYEYYYDDGYLQEDFYFFDKSLKMTDQLKTYWNIAWKKIWERKFGEANVKEECIKCKTKDNLKFCGRCRTVKYCGVACQKIHIKEHKIICKDVARRKRFEQIQRDQCFFILAKNTKRTKVFPSCFANVDDDEASLLNVCPLLVEIVAKEFHPFRIGVTIEDIKGERRRLFFYAESKSYTFEREKGPEPIQEKYKKGKTVPLSECAELGNFMVLYMPLFHLFLDLTTGFRINDLDEVDFFFPIKKEL